MITEKQLELTKTLPTKPNPLVIEGKHVILEPYNEQKHSEELFLGINGSPVTLLDKTLPAYDDNKLVWQYLYTGPFHALGDFQESMKNHESEPNRTIFIVIHKESKKPVGTISLMSNVPSALKIELGSIFYSPIVQRTVVNTEANYLLLEHCFNLGYRRIEWKCNNENERSKSAATRLGFQFEGIQMYHFISKGRNRDTAWFRILDFEWPTVRSNLLERLSDGYYTPK